MQIPFPPPGWDDLVPVLERRILTQGSGPGQRKYVRVMKKKTVPEIGALDAQFSDLNGLEIPYNLSTTNLCIGIVGQFTGSPGITLTHGTENVPLRTKVTCTAGLIGAIAFGTGLTLEAASLKVAVTGGSVTNGFLFGGMPIPAIANGPINMVRTTGTMHDMGLVSGVLVPPASAFTLWIAKGGQEYGEARFDDAPYTRAKQVRNSMYTAVWDHAPLSGRFGYLNNGISTTQRSWAGIGVNPA